MGGAKFQSSSFNQGLLEAIVRLRRILGLVRKIIPVKFRHKFPSIGRFVPHSSRFSSADRYYLKRDETKFIINRSDYVQWRIFYGVRDNALLSAKKYLNRNGLVLDIGASVGAFSLKLAMHMFKNQVDNITVHAFEPNPTVMELLERNLSLNPELKPVIQVQNFGFGNESGMKAFRFNFNNTGAGRVVPEGQLKIEIKKLDDFVNEIRPVNIAFIKLIVEGFEPEVIKGGWQTIQKYTPPIFLEVTPTWWQENHATVLDVLNPLKELGYTFLIERYNELVPLIPNRDLPGYQFNLLAIPK
jgi:FkbM family methyltransferase